MVYRQICYKNFDKLQFRVDIIKVEWRSFCHDLNPNSALEHFLKVVEKLPDKQAPYQNIRHPKSQFETTPWITLGLSYSIKIKNKIYKSFCKKRDRHKKENSERHFKIYCNVTSTLLRQTKESYLRILFILALKTKTQVFLSPTVPADVEGLISSIKTNKASCRNSVPSNILKLFKKEFSKHLKLDCHLPKKNVIICFNDSLSKMMKNAIYLILKALFVFKIFKFLSSLFGHVKIRLDQKDKIIFGIYDVTVWLTIN